MKLFVLALFCAASVYGAAVPENVSLPKDDFTLPEFVKTCNQDDPNLNQCIKEALTDMMPRLNNGLKSLQIPPMDPFTVERTQFNYGSTSGPIQGAIKMKNVKTYGMSQAVFRDVNMNFDGDRVSTDIEIHFPKIFMEGAYKADVKFNDLKLHPKGRFNVTMLNIDVIHHWTGELINKDGHKYLQIDDFDMIPEVGDMKIHMTGVFPDQTMTELANNFLNQYWPALYKMLLPETRIYWKPIMIEAINEFLGRVPFDSFIKPSSE